MPTDLRCQGKKHGVLIDDETVEIKCNSRWCGAASGIVVLHRFDLRSGELLETLRYADPITEGGESHGTQHHSDPVRSA